MKITKQKKSKLELEIERLLDEMNLLPTDSEKYKILADRLEQLTKANGYVPNKPKVNMDIVVQGAFSILGIVLIISSEEAKILSKNALGFVLKGRV